MYSGTPLEKVKGIGAVMAKRLRDHGIPSTEFLARVSHSDLSFLQTKVTMATMRKLIANARELLEFDPVNGLDLENKEQKPFTTGLPSFDRTLNGGLRIGSLIQIYGPSRGGKTILSSQLAVRAHLPEELGGLSTKTLWISTQRSFHHIHIRTMALRYGIEGDSVLENIIVQEVVNLEHFLEVLKSIPDLINKEGIRFIVVDNLGALFEIEYSSYSDRNFMNRTLSECLDKLRTIAEAMNGICVFTNPVFEQISNYGGNPNAPMNGHTIAHGSDYRLYIRRTRREQRKLMLQKGPGLPESDIELHIGWGGLYDEIRDVKIMNQRAMDIIEVYRERELEEMEA